MPRRHYTADVRRRWIVAHDFRVHGIVDALAIGSPGAKVCAPGPKQIQTEAPQFICASVPRIHHAQAYEMPTLAVFPTERSFYGIESQDCQLAPSSAMASDDARGLAQGVQRFSISAPSVKQSRPQTQYWPVYLPFVKRTALRASEVAAKNSRLKSRVAATTAIRRSISGPVAKASRVHRAQDRFVRVDPAIGRELVLSATTFSSTLESRDSHSVAAW
jgi:hypothetical protein